MRRLRLTCAIIHGYTRRLERKVIASATGRRSNRRVLSRPFPVFRSADRLQTTPTNRPSPRRRSHGSRPQAPRPTTHTARVSTPLVGSTEQDSAPVKSLELGLDPHLARALADRDFRLTTPVQSAVYQPVYRGEDLIACAQTGTGKTVAFLLPSCSGCSPRPARPSAAAPRVLILAPTRELAVQIEDGVPGPGLPHAAHGAAVYGGVEHGPAGRALRRRRRHHRRHARAA